MRSRVARLRGRVGQAAGVLAAGLALVSLAILWPLAEDLVAGPREIVVVARDMAFYLEGSRSPNPVIGMTSGETIRLTIRNENRGVVHNFQIASWDISVTRLKGGESGSIVIRVPNRPGRHAYTCAPHQALMNGIVEVVAAN